MTTWLHDAATAWPLAPVTPDVLLPVPVPVPVPVPLPLPPFLALFPALLLRWRVASVLLLNSDSGARKIGTRDFVLGNLSHKFNQLRTSRSKKQSAHVVVG